MRLARVLPLLLLAACGLDPGSASLRIRNDGAEPIAALTVFSPGSEVEFGNIGAGETSQYRVMPGRVYSYAAFEFTEGGVRVSQPVIDFVGESPRRGSHFTYTVSLTSTASGCYILISGVTRDR